MTFFVTVPTHNCTRTMGSWDLGLAVGCRQPPTAVLLDNKVRHEETVNSIDEVPRRVFASSAATAIYPRASKLLDGAAAGSVAPAPRR